MTVCAEDALVASTASTGVRSQQLHGLEESTVCVGHTILAQWANVKRMCQKFENSSWEVVGSSSCYLEGSGLSF